MSRAFLGTAVLCAALSGSLPAPTSLAREEQTPYVKIAAPRGGQTQERLVEIEGSVQGIDAKRLTLVLNGVRLSIPRTDEGFKTKQVLAPGWNAIRVVAEKHGRYYQDEVAVFARVPRKDLRIALTWDTDGTDVDLWVTGPDGEKVFYSHSKGKAGGSLDVDVTRGYGPETYTQTRVASGTYLIQAHYFRGARPTRVQVTIIEREGTPTERRRVFRGILIRKDEELLVGRLQVP